MPSATVLHKGRISRHRFARIDQNAPPAARQYSCPATTGNLAVSMAQWITRQITTARPAPPPPLAGVQPRQIHLQTVGARRLGSCVGVEYRKSICKISRMSRHRPPAQAHCSGLRAAHARPDQRDEKQRTQRPVGDTDPVVIAMTHDHHFRPPCQPIGQQRMGLRNRAGNRQNRSPLGIGFATAREIGGLQFLGLSDGNQFHRDAARLQIRGHLRLGRGSGRNADRPPPSASVRPVRANALYAITLVAPRHQECTGQAEVPRGRDQA